MAALGGPGAIAPAGGQAHQISQDLDAGRNGPLGGLVGDTRQDRSEARLGAARPGQKIFGFDHFHRISPLQMFGSEHNGGMGTGNNNTPNDRISGAGAGAPSPCPPASGRRFSRKGRDMTRDEAIQRIRKALKKRSRKSWSVKGGLGTAWGWITITAPPRRCTGMYQLIDGRDDEPENYKYVNGTETGQHISVEDRKELAKLLGFESVHFQGVSIAASSDYRNEYVDRAEGREPSVIGQQYWD